MPGTVVVGCKIPTGLRIQLHKLEDFAEPVMAGGTRMVKRAVPESAAVVLKGSARYIGKDTSGDIKNGAGLTYDVDADMFTEWLKRNKDEPYVKNGLVFAQERPGEAKAQARDHLSLKSGLEPIDPGNLAPEFRGKIKTA